jgi:hypothetical protein
VLEIFGTNETWRCDILQYGALLAECRQGSFSTKQGVVQCLTGLLGEGWVLRSCIWGFLKKVC